ncbi:hypothetical protein BBAD15_g693 [Beauveria bassiana D1-5]|uniref:Uncharacterized protein n=1 Tax=Beauveria bassiana D1-5 TaxID=1245745 RepID=A0A0A2W4Y5_BEABA|nr:hypothetical protein BBAD15_g693 [Beauveria bassiana D1-5]
MGVWLKAKTITGIDIQISPSACRSRTKPSEVSNQRENQEPHYFDGHLPPHQEDQVQRRNDAEANQHPDCGGDRPVFGQLLDERIGNRDGINQDHHEERQEVEPGDQVADSFAVVMGHGAGDAAAARGFRRQDELTQRPVWPIGQRVGNQCREKENDGPG